MMSTADHLGRRLTSEGRECLDSNPDSTDTARQQQQRAVKNQPGKTCRTCSCQFKPRRPYYQFCDRCFAKRRAIEAERAYRRRFPDE